MTKIDVDILVISLTSPLLVGVYKENKLINNFKSTEKTSDILPVIFDEILKKYNVKNLYYARGPGSFMSIKVSYIFLRTLSITKKIPFYGADGFNFNNNSPIKATGNRFFMKENGKIIIKKLEKKDSKIQSFKLYTHLDKKIFSREVEPLYVLPAI